MLARDCETGQKWRETIRNFLSTEHDGLQMPFVAVDAGPRPVLIPYKRHKPPWQALGAQSTRCVSRRSIEQSQEALQELVVKQSLFCLFFSVIFRNSAQTQYISMILDHPVCLHIGEFNAFDRWYRACNWLESDLPFFN